MNHTSMMLIVVMLFALFAKVVLGTPDSVRAQQSSGKANRPESPFACNRLALTAEQRKRHFDELGPKLRSLRLTVRELPNGYEFEFPPDSNTVRFVAEWAVGERACCPFFDIDLRLQREGGPLWLVLTGREGVKQFIRSDGAAWIRQ